MIAVRFEDKLRARPPAWEVATTRPPWKKGDAWYPVSSEERDALADAVTTLRRVRHWLEYQTLDTSAVDEVLARLDGAA